jgi:tRNA(Arg) A34 adenosine deaminase TadA
MKVSVKAQRNIFLFLSIVLFIGFLSYIFSPVCNKIKPTVKITKVQKDSLIQLASRALSNGDLPIAAILLYNGKIIGEGFNTVQKDTNADGHAEINAIKSAFKAFGYSGFKKLNRDSLVLISTYEPCIMCKGVICNYDIKNVFFLKSKGFGNWMKNERKIHSYDWNCKRTGDDNIHDSLFKFVIKK